MKYLKKFGNVTASNAPLEFVDAGWAAWDASNYFEVQSDTGAFEDQSLTFVQATTARYGCKWEPLGTITDGEFLVRMKTGSAVSTRNQTYVCFRGTGSSGLESGYVVGIYNGDLQIAEIINGSYSGRATDTDPSLSSYERFWIRARIVNDDSSQPTISAKAWPTDQPEPKDWMQTWKDTATPFAQGWAGLYGRDTGYNCDFISFTDDPENESAPYELPDLIENFKDLSVDDSPPDFTSKWETGGHTFKAAADTDAIQQRVAAFSLTSDERYNYCWDKISPDFTDGEVLIRFETDATLSLTYNAQITLRGSGAATSEDGYLIRTYEDELYIGEFNAGGAFTQFAVTTTSPVAASSWYWIRARIEGLDLKAKIWAVSSDEPASWDLTYTDTGGTRTSGWVGIGVFNGDVHYDYISVGYGDDPAKMVITQDWTNLTTFSDEFTSRWGTDIDTETIETLAGYEEFTFNSAGKLFHYEPGATEYQLHTWDKIPAAIDDIEWLGAFVAISASSEAVQFYARAGGAAGGTESGYYAQCGDSFWTGLREVTAGSNSTILNTYGGAVAGMAYWCRFRVNGTSLKYKEWLINTPEPVEWQLEATDSTHTSGTHGTGIGVAELSYNVGFLYLACGINGDSPQVPMDYRPVPVDLGTQYIENISGYTTTLNGAYAAAIEIPFPGFEVSGITIQSRDDPWDGNFRMAVYVNNDPSDMSDATLLEDLGIPTEGQGDCTQPYYFSQTYFFSPGTAVWIVVKSNNNTVAITHHPDTHLPFQGHIISPLRTYTTDLGSDETVAFSSTTGTLTAGTTYTRSLGVSLIVSGGGVFDGNWRFKEDFSAIATGSTSGATGLDGWRSIGWPNNDFDHDIIEDSDCIGGKYYRLTSDTSYIVSLTPEKSSYRVDEVFKMKGIVQRILARIRIPSGSTRASLSLRAKPHDTFHRAYTFMAEANNDYQRVTFTEGSNFSPVVAEAAHTIDTDTWYWLRAESIGATQRMKLWSGGIGDEPVAWDIDYDEDDATSSTGFWCGYPAIAVDVSGDLKAEYDIVIFTGYPTLPEIAFDEFTGTNDDPPDSSLWTNVADGFEELVIYNNQLRCERQGQASWEYPNAVLNQTLAGDFTMIVDFDLQTVREASADGSGFYLRIDNDDVTESLRMGAGYYGGQTFNWREIAGGVAQGWEYTSRTNSTGKLAIVRSGTTITLKYQDGTGSWATADTFSSKWTTETTFKLWGTIQTAYHATDAYSDFRFDNFRLYDFADPGDGAPAGSTYKPAVIIVT